MASTLVSFDCVGRDLFLTKKVVRKLECIPMLFWIEKRLVLENVLPRIVCISLRVYQEIQKYDT